MSTREPHVFIVDDDPQLRKALRALIAGAGFNVRSFCSANEFLVALGELGRGCVILDVRLPT